MTYVEEMQFLVFLESMLTVHQKLDEKSSHQYYKGAVDALEAVLNEYKSLIVDHEEAHAGN